MKRSQFLWNVLVGVAVLVLLVTGYRFNNVREQVTRYGHMTEKSQLGTDQELDSLITYLENNLLKRESYHFSLRNEPMLLSNVILLSDELAAGRQRDIIRVSAIVGGSKAIALVQYHGQTYRLMVGDTLAGGKVIDIKPEAMVLYKHNRRMTFPVIGLKMSPEEAEKYRVD